MKFAALVLLVLILLLGGMGFTQYNAIINKQEMVSASYADIDAQLQRRSDLIPNLLNSVKGYMSHEQGIIDAITQSREKLSGATNVGELAQASGEMESALKNLMVVVEQYPDLKANTNFIQLQDELSGTENRIATARRDYNDAVRSFNAQIKRFPGSLLASYFGFNPATYFEASEVSQEVPNVSF